MTSLDRVLNGFGPKRYAPRPVPLSLGMSDIDGASNFLRIYFPREYVCAFLYKPEKHITHQYNSLRNEDTYRLNQVFVSQGFLSLLRVARTAVALINRDIPFVGLGESFSFDTSIPVERADLIGKFPDHLPALDDDSENPLDKDFHLETDLLRCAHGTQRLIRKFLRFIERAYNKMGQSENWDFESVLAPVSGNHFNACYPNLATKGTTKLRNEANESAQTPEDLPPPPVSPVAITVQVPQPTPVAGVSGPELIEDLNRVAEYLGQLDGNFDRDKAKLVSIANHPAVVDPKVLNKPKEDPSATVTTHFVHAAVDPKLSENGQEEEVLSAAPRFIHNEPELDDSPFHPDCACGTHQFIKLAYARGREDEFGRILRDNHDHGFIAHRLEDFFEFASASTHQVKINDMPVEVNRDSPPPLIGSPMDSDLAY
jgi:hypothetical protein